MSVRSQASFFTRKTDAGVDLFAAEAADALDHGGDLGRAAEEDEDLVDGVRGQVVGEPVRRERELLPGALELRTEAVESNRRCTISADGLERIYTEHTSTQTQITQRQTCMTSHTPQREKSRRSRCQVCGLAGNAVSPD